MLKAVSPPAILTACDREPIHILGAIQPFGFLLSVNADWLVSRALENVEKFIGVAHAQAVGQSAEDCLSAVHASARATVSFRNGK
jgi:light-regulated signal transduction histidine kinase (bacteriophytochrome)